MRLMHISDLHLGTSLYDTDITADIEHALFSEILGRIYREVSAQGRMTDLSSQETFSTRLSHRRTPRKYTAGC